MPKRFNRYSAFPMRYMGQLEQGTPTVGTYTL